MCWQFLIMFFAFFVVFFQFFLIVLLCSVSLLPASLQILPTVAKLPTEPGARKMASKDTEMTDAKAEAAKPAAPEPPAPVDPLAQACCSFCMRLGPAPLSTSELTCRNGCVAGQAERCAAGEGRDHQGDALHVSRAATGAPAGLQSGTANGSHCLCLNLRRCGARAEPLLCVCAKTLAARLRKPTEADTQAFASTLLEFVKARDLRAKPCGYSHFGPAVQI